MYARVEVIISYDTATAMFVLILEYKHIVQISTVILYIPRDK